MTFRAPLIITRLPARQYTFDVVNNPILPAPFVDVRTIDGFSLFIPNAPFANVIESSFAARRQYVPEVVENPVLPPLAVAATAPFFAPVDIIKPPSKQYVSDVLVNSVAIGVAVGTEVLCIQRQMLDAPDSFRLKTQYIADIGTTSAALNVAVGTEALCIQRDPNPDSFRLPRQYIADIGTNPVALSAGTSIPFVTPSSIFDVAHKIQQYVPDVVGNITINIQPVPLVAELMDTPRSIKQQYIPDVVLNPVSLAQPPPSPPFVPWLLDISRAGRQYVPDVLFNPVALNSGGTATPLIPAFIEQPGAKRQFIPDILVNPVALDVKPGTEVLCIQRQMLDAPDFFRLKVQYVVDIGTNPIIPRQYNIPPTPDFIEQPRAWRQYIPDVLDNPIIPLQSGVPFVPNVFDQPKPAKQYGVEVLDNPLLPTGGPFAPPSFDIQSRPSRLSRADVGTNPVVPLQSAVPFTPGLFDGAATRRQYVSDVVSNQAVLGSQVVAAPFIPYGFDQPKVGKQYVFDVVQNATIILQRPLVPFIPAPFDIPRSWRQFVPDQVLNTGVLVPVPAVQSRFDQAPTPKRLYVPDVLENPVLPPMVGVVAVPFAVPLFDQPKIPRQYVPSDAGTNPVIPLKSAVPFTPKIFDPPKVVRPYVVDVAPSSLALRTPVPFIPVQFDPPRIGCKAGLEAVANRLPLISAGVVAAPFIPYQADILRASRPYVPDVLPNSTIRLQPPFIPYSFDAPKASKQYVPVVQFNPVIPDEIVPFIVPLFDAPRAARQYQVDVYPNTLVFAPPPSLFPLFVPYIYEVQRRAIQYVPDILFNPVVLAPGQPPIPPQQFGTSIFEALGSPHELGSALRSGMNRISTSASELGASLRSGIDRISSKGD